MPGSRIAAQPQDIFNEHARASADQQVAFVLRFPGRIDAAELEQAVRRTIAAQPVLGSRFVMAGRRAHFEPVADAAGRAFALHDADDSWAVALDLAAFPLSPAAGPLLGVDLVRGSGADAIAVRIDHTAADGQGAKQCLYLIASAMGREPAPQPGDRSWRRLKRRFSLARRIAAVRARQAPRPTWGLSSAGRERGRRRFVVESMRSDEFRRARDRARESGATVNDLALAGFYRALWDALDAPPERPMAVNVSFDMRRYLGESDPMPPAANLSSTETALLTRVAGETFRDTLARATAEAARLKTGQPGLGSAFLLEYVGRLQGATGLRRTVVEPMERGRAAGISFPFLSNFGVLDPGRLVFGGVVPDRAIVLGPAGYAPFMMLGVSSYQDTLTLASGYAEGETDGALVARIVQDVAHDLREYAGG